VIDRLIFDDRADRAMRTMVIIAIEAVG